MAQAKAILREARAVFRDILAFGSLLSRKVRPTDSGANRQLLFVDNLVPDPTFGAGYPRAFEMVKDLVGDGWQVTVYPLQGGRKQAKKVQALLPSVCLLTGEGARGLRRLLRTRGRDFAALIISRPEPMAAYIEAARGRNFAPVIYDAEALLAAREVIRRRMFGIPWTPEELESAAAREIALAQPARAIMAVTPVEAALFQAHLGVPVAVASHSLPVPASDIPFDRRRDLLFVGRLTGECSTSPNVDSIVWFVTDVMPLLDELIGTDYRLHLIGLLDSEVIADLISDRVIAHGVVDDLDPFFDQAKVFIAPTRYSAGLPLKVVEAMTRGLPSATTPLLKKQLGEAVDTDDEPSASAFAEEVSQLYQNEKKWQSAREFGLERAAKDFSPEAFKQAIRNTLHAAGVNWGSIDYNNSAAVMQNLEQA